LKATALAPLAFLFLSVPAQAELLQTWRLTATTYQVADGFMAPSFVEIGQNFYIDYVIDIETPGSDLEFNRAIKSISVNGITSLTDGYVWSTWGGELKAINVQPFSARADGITFVSLNNFSGNYYQELVPMLADFAAAAPTPAVDLRLDFGVNNIWAHTSSFVMAVAVPEPSSVLLMLIGLPMLTLRRYGSRRTGVFSAHKL
jgi:hypothetical protein